MFLILNLPAYTGIWLNCGDTGIWLNSSDGPFKQMTTLTIVLDDNNSKKDPQHTVPHVTLLVSKGKFTSGLDFFLSPPENKKAFAL